MWKVHFIPGIHFAKDTESKSLIPALGNSGAFADIQMVSK
jgi:hypothetical protein